MGKKRNSRSFITNPEVY